MILILESAALSLATALPAVAFAVIVLLDRRSAGRSREDRRIVWLAEDVVNAHLAKEKHT